MKAIKQKNENQIRDLILNSIKEEVDFREVVFGASKENTALKLNRKHYIVIIVSEFLKTVKENKFDLCVKNGKIYLFNGKFWQEESREQFSILLGKVAEKMGADEFDSKHFGFIEDLLKQFFVTAILEEPKKEENTVLMNADNGTVEFSFSQNGVHIELREHRKEDFSTNILPFKYNEKAQAPIWSKFLNEVLPDESKQKVLSEFMGYLFVSPKVQKHEKVLMLYGGGSNGKSVVFEVLNALLGSDNITNFNLENLTDSTGYYRAEIENKLLNYASEIGTRLDSTIFKQLASCEKITARSPYSKPITIEKYAKLIFNSNNLPQSNEHTNAYYRRFLILHFDQVIAEENQDKELSKKIIENELSGVLNWVVTGLQRLLEQKRFTHSEAVENSLNQYKTQSDTVRLFLQEENYNTSENKVISLQELYVNYKSFCLIDGYRFITKIAFSNQLKNIGIQTVRRNTGNYVFLEKTVITE